ncbi:MAG: hypothetical protein ACI9GH_000262 [Candidatus Paceibacteria bacterium]|jgi:hypothetical protein
MHFSKLFKWVLSFTDKETEQEQNTKRSTPIPVKEETPAKTLDKFNCKVTQRTVTYISKKGAKRKVPLHHIKSTKAFFYPSGSDGTMISREMI